MGWSFEQQQDDFLKPIHHADRTPSGAFRLRFAARLTEKLAPSSFGVQECMPDIHVKPKVLVVDDERVIADTLAMILNQSGFQATAVYSGEAALETASTYKPDMLIADE